MSGDGGGLHMSLFAVGGLYQGKYLVESVVPFFQGELAIATYNEQRYYLQSATLHRQAPVRAIAQYLNLQIPQVIPYREVMYEPDMLVFVRPYIAIRPLREVIENEELSEEQVVRWVRDLLHVEAVLKAKPMPMYLLLDLRNVGVTAQNELMVFFCGLDQIMVYESKLDWGTFIYSMLSGQFLDGPIIKLPKHFKVSRPMARLIQKSFKEYTVSPVLEQVELFENKQQNSGLLSKFWGDKKEEAVPILTPNISSSSIDSPIGRPVFQITDTESKSAEITLEERTSPNSDVQKDITLNITEPIVLKKEEHIVEIIEEPEEAAMKPVWAEASTNGIIEPSKVEEFSEPDLIDEEPIETQTEPTLVEESINKPEPEEEPILDTEESIQEEPATEAKDETETQEETKDLSVEENTIEDEVVGRFHPKTNRSTVKISPALEQLDEEDHDLSNSFVLKLNLQQLELERKQQERLKTMREEFERKEQELIDQHRRQLEAEQQRLLEEQRKKLEQEQEEALKKKREALANHEKEKRRKEKLAKERKLFEEREQQLLKDEELFFQERQAELVAQLTAEFEARKQALLKQQQQEFEARTKQKMAELDSEWKTIEAAENGAVSEEQTSVPTVELTEKSGKTDEVITKVEPLVEIDQVELPQPDVEPVETQVDDLQWDTEEPQQNDRLEQETVFASIEVSSKPDTQEVESNDSYTEENVQELEPKIIVEETETPVISTTSVNTQVEEEQEAEIEAVFSAITEEKTSEQPVSVEAEEPVEATDKVTEEASEEGEVTEGEAPKKKKRRRRRRRKKKPTETEATTEAASSAEAVEPNKTVETAKTVETESTVEDERKRRERELEQMERELLELEQQEKVQQKQIKQKPVQEKKVEEEIFPEKEETKTEEESTPTSPVVHKAPKPPVVTDTTEHATLAKQFEQYLKLFQKKK